MIQTTKPIVTPNQPFKTIKLWKELVILVGFALIIFGVGQFVGAKFFWNQFDKTPLVDRAYESALAKAKQAPTDPYSHINLGWALLQKGKYNEAIVEYKKATELDDKNSQAYLNLGLAYQKVQKYDIAITNFQKVIELSPKGYEAHYYLGLTYQSTAKYDLALQQLGIADQLNPGSSQIIYDTAQTKEKMGNIAGAKSDYNYVLQYDPNFTKATDALKRLGGAK